MTYIVSSGALNSTHSLTHSCIAAAMVAGSLTVFRRTRTSGRCCWNAERICPTTWYSSTMKVQMAICWSNAGTRQAKLMTESKLKGTREHGYVFFRERKTFFFSLNFVAVSVWHRVTTVWNALPDTVIPHWDIRITLDVEQLAFLCDLVTIAVNVSEEPEDWTVR